jgi:polygalacturonase
MHRRNFLTHAAALAVGHRLLPAVTDVDPEAEQAGILRRIKPPVFPRRDFDIVRYGAESGGAKNCSDAFRKAIAACTAAGGGRVVVPPGVFLTGTVHLDNNVNLYVGEGATLRFSQKPEDYLPVVYTRWEGTECMNFSPLIYAFEKTNIGITGTGMLDGGADEQHWWAWKGGARRNGGPNQTADRDALVASGEKGVPVSERVYGGGHYLRPNFIQPYRCTNVVMDGLKIRNSPMWELNPVLCPQREHSQYRYRYARSE